MRTYMVIPTYWSGPNGEWEEGDAVYDHATPLNEDGTLLRTLKSIDILDDKHFTLILLAAATNDKYVKPMEEKLAKMLQSINIPVDTLVFTNTHLNKLKKIMYKDLKLPNMLDLKGYSNIRNLCIFLPYILDGEVAILIDDDEVFEDPKFVTKAKEFIGRRFYGNTIDGVAGYYLNEDNEYYDKVNIQPWMTYWDRFGGKREAFDMIIGSEPRLKKTPFAFGGAMVIHRNLMRIVPFDPKTTRGEDTDYVINSRMFGFNFFLDNKLAIKHLPPPKNHPVWKRFREDIYRFLYDKSKFDNQKFHLNLHKILPEDFDPYPGEFMKPDLGDKIFKTNIILALNYLADNDVESCKETIKNIYLAKYEAIPHYDTFETYLEFQKNWRKLLEHTKDFGNELKDIVLESRIVTFDKYLLEKKKILNESGISDAIDFENIDIFKDFTKKELRRIFFISNILEFKRNDYIFKAGKHCSGIFVVLKGNLNILKKHKVSGDMMIVSELGAGDHFNESSIFTDTPHTVSIMASSEVHLMKIEKDKLLEVIKENSELSSKILWTVSKKLSENLEDTTQKYSKTKEQDSDVSEIV
ncbi:MAG: cyclic nucleotide-binding domain-containing protein [Candidatus Cloacimonetes bacterium]|nr:cyclic nucleotide-binding domain-containing protein [Candidatus Cloacimonadota bacterium]